MQWKEMKEDDDNEEEVGGNETVNERKYTYNVQYYTHTQWWLQYECEQSRAEQSIHVCMLDLNVYLCMYVKLRIFVSMYVCVHMYAQIPGSATVVVVIESVKTFYLKRRKKNTHTQERSTR